MNQFENISQLRAEINRLQQTRKKLELDIKTDLKGIREDFRPENIFWNALSSFTGVRMSKDEFFKDGIAFGLSLLLQRFVLKTEKKMENKVYDFIDALFDRIKNLVSKVTGAQAKRGERKETASDFASGE